MSLHIFRHDVSFFGDRFGISCAVLWRFIGEVNKTFKVIAAKEHHAALFLHQICCTVMQSSICLTVCVGCHVYSCFALTHAVHFPRLSSFISSSRHVYILEVTT